MIKNLNKRRKNVIASSCKRQMETSNEQPDATANPTDDVKLKTVSNAFVNEKAANKPIEQEQKKNPIPSQNVQNQIPRQTEKNKNYIPLQIVGKKYSIPTQNVHNKNSIPLQIVGKKYSISTQNGRHKNLIPPHNVEKKILIATHTDENNNPSIPSQNVQKKISIPSQTEEKKNSIPPQNLEQKNPIPPQNVEKKNTVPPQNVEKKNSILPQNVEKKNPIPTQNIEKKNPIPPQNVEKKNPISTQNVQKKNPIPTENVEKKDPIPPQNVEKKNPILPQNVEKKNTIPTQNVEKKNPVPPQNVEKKNSILPQNVEKKNPIPTQNIEKKNPIPPKNVEKKRPISTQNVEKKNPIPPQNVEKKNPIPSQNVEKKTPILPQNVEKKDPIPPQNVEKKNPVPPQNVEKKNPVPPQNVEKKNPVPPQNVEKKNPIPPQNVEKKNPIPPQNVEKKNSVPPQNVEKKNSILPQNVEKKNPIPTENVEKKNPVPPQNVETKNPIPPQNVEKKTPILPQNVERKNTNSLQSVGISKIAVDKIAAKLKEQIIKKNSIPPQNTEKKILIATHTDENHNPSIPSQNIQKKISIPRQTEEKKNSIPPQNVEKKIPIHSQNVEKKNPISTQNVEKKNSIPPQDVEKKIANPSQNVEKKIPISSQNVEKKTLILSQSVEKRTAIRPQNVAKKNPIPPQNVKTKDLIAPQNIGVSKLASPAIKTVIKTKSHTIVNEKTDKSVSEAIVIRPSDEKFLRGTVSSNAKKKIDIQKTKKVPPKRIGLARSMSSIHLAEASIPKPSSPPPFAIDRVRDNFLNSSRTHWKEFNRAEKALLETYTVLGLESPVVPKPDAVKSTSTYNPVKKQKSCPSRHKEAKMTTVINNLNKADLIALKEDGKPVDSLTLITQKPQSPVKKDLKPKAKKVNKTKKSVPDIISQPSAPIPIKNENPLEKLKEIVEDWKAIESTVSYLHQVYNIKDQTSTKSLVTDGNDLLKSKALVLKQLSRNMNKDQGQNMNKALEDKQAPVDPAKTIQDSLETATPEPKTLGDNKGLEDSQCIKVVKTLSDQKVQRKESFVNKVAKSSLRGSVAFTDLCSDDSRKASKETIVSYFTTDTDRSVAKNFKTLNCVYCGAMKIPFQKARKKCKHKKKTETNKLRLLPASSKDYSNAGTTKSKPCKTKISKLKKNSDTSSMNSMKSSASQTDHATSVVSHLQSSKGENKPDKKRCEACCIEILQEKENLCFGDLQSNDNNDIDNSDDKEQLIVDDIGGDEITCPLYDNYLSPLQSANTDTSSINSQAVSLTYKNVRYCVGKDTTKWDENNNLGAETDDSLEEHNCDVEAESVDSLEELSKTQSNNHFFKALCRMRFKLGSKDSGGGNTLTDDNDFESESEPVESPEKSPDTETTTNIKLLNLSFCNNLDCAETGSTKSESFEDLSPVIKTEGIISDLEEDGNMLPSISLSHLGDRKIDQNLEKIDTAIYCDNSFSTVSTDCFDLDDTHGPFLEKDMQAYSISSLDALISSSCDVMNISTEESSRHIDTVSLGEDNNLTSTDAIIIQNRLAKKETQEQDLKKYIAKDTTKKRCLRTSSMIALVDEDEKLSSLEVSPFNSNDDLTEDRCCYCSGHQHNYLPLSVTESIAIAAQNVHSRRRKNSDEASSLTKGCVTRFCKWCNRVLSIQK